MISAIALTSLLTPSFTDLILDNGLRVILDPQPHHRTVAVMMAFPAGAASEPPGRTGLAHLVEHLMFRSSRIEPFASNIWVASLGGDFNGVTAPDRTWYWEEVPPEGLETALLFQRERLAFKRDAITQTDLEREQAIVARELEVRGWGGAWHKVRRLREQTLYGEPSWVSSLYEKEEVQRHTLEEVRWFIEAYYRPDAAVLAVAGQFDEKHAQTFIKTRFGSLSKPSNDLPPRPSPGLQVPPRDQVLLVKAPNKAEEISFVFTTPRAGGFVLRRLASEILRRVQNDFSRDYKASVHRARVWTSENGPLQTLSFSIEGKGSKTLSKLFPSYRDFVSGLEPKKHVSEKLLALARRTLLLKIHRNHDSPPSRVSRAIVGALYDEETSPERCIARLEEVTLEEVREWISDAISVPPLIARQIYHDDLPKAEFVEVVQ